MTSYMEQRMRAIPVKQKTRVDISKLNTIDNDIKTRCMSVTMKLLRDVKPISDQSTYPNVARYMMTLAASCPIKCMCVGISPYENGILPSFASALSYDPLKSSGCTPSVQALSQVMSSVANLVKTSHIDRAKYSLNFEPPSKYEYTAKFAMMLRRSYSCLCAGVAFVNCSPMVTSNFAKRMRCGSLFSEWLGNMIRIHSEHRYTMSIVSMGAQAEMCMNDCFKAFEDTRKCVSSFATVNPAMFSHMNITKILGKHPIPDLPTDLEMTLNRIGNQNTDVARVSYLDWYEYPIALVSQIMKTRSLWRLVSLLVDEAPEQLLTEYVSLIRNTTKYTMSFPNDIMGLLATGDEGGFMRESQDVQSERYETMAANPFLAAQSDTNPDVTQVTDTNQVPDPSRGQYSNSGQPMIDKRSTIAQMIDPQGKAVSQHVIILDSLIKTVSDASTGYKDMHKDMVTIATRQAEMVKTMATKRILSQDEVQSMNEFLEDFKSAFGELLKKMEEHLGICSALPQILEGMTGIYEHETQPSAPLLRRNDGSTMKDYVYGRIVESGSKSVDRNQSEPESTTPTTTTTSINPFLPTESQDANSDAYEDLSVVLEQPKYAKMTRYMNRTSREMVDTGEIQESNVLRHSVTVGRGAMSVIEALSIIVFEYVTTLPPGSMPVNVVRNMILSCSGDEADSLVSMIPDWIRTTTSAIEACQLFDQDESDDENSTEQTDSIA